MWTNAFKKVFNRISHYCNIFATIMNENNTPFSGNANTWQHTRAALVHWLQLGLICQDPRQASKVVGLEGSENCYIRFHYCQIIFVTFSWYFDNCYIVYNILMLHLLCNIFLKMADIVETGRNK